MIIANVSPCRMCAQESLSTLQFASRAKHIRNKAVINQDTNGDVAMLQREVVRLRRYVLRQLLKGTHLYSPPKGDEPVLAVAAIITVLALTGLRCCIRS